MPTAVLCRLAVGGGLCPRLCGTSYDAAEGNGVVALGLELNVAAGGFADHTVGGHCRFVVDGCGEEDCFSKFELFIHWRCCCSVIVRVM